MKRFLIYVLAVLFTTLVIVGTDNSVYAFEGNNQGINIAFNDLVPHNVNTNLSYNSQNNVYKLVNTSSSAFETYLFNLNTNKARDFLIANNFSLRFKLLAGSINSVKINATKIAGINNVFAIDSNVWYDFELGSLVWFDFLIGMQPNSTIYFEMLIVMGGDFRNYSNTYLYNVDTVINLDSSPNVFVGLFQFRNAMFNSFEKGNYLFVFTTDFGGIGTHPHIRNRFLWANDFHFERMQVIYSSYYWTVSVEFWETGSILTNRKEFYYFTPFGSNLTIHSPDQAVINNVIQANWSMTYTTILNPDTVLVKQFPSSRNWGSSTTNANSYGNFTYSLSKTNPLPLSDEFTNGYQSGYQSGLRAGRLEQSNSGVMQVLIGGFAIVGNIMAVELLPNITIGALIMVPIVFGLIYFIIGKRNKDE